jgi:hypothetical protein
MKKREGDHGARSHWEQSADGTGHVIDQTLEGLYKLAYNPLHCEAFHQESPNGVPVNIVTVILRRISKHTKVTDTRSWHVPKATVQKNKETGKDRSFTSCKEIVNCIQDTFSDKLAIHHSIPGPGLPLA